MKKAIKSIILLLVLTMSSAVASAYDFMVDGLAYKKLTTNTAAVTAVDFQNNYPSLTVASISDKVTFNNVTYSVIAIDDFAFYQSPKLASVQLPNSIKTIGTYAFWGCTALSGVTIGDRVTSVGAYAFASTAVSNIILPNSVTTIGDYAIYNCSALKYLTIGSSVSSIGQYAFASNSNLTKITCFKPSPVSINSTVFEGINYTSCQLCVPVNSLEAYSLAPVWSNFANISEGTTGGDDNEQVGANFLHSEPQTLIRPNRTLTVAVEMTNETTLSALQFNMYLPSNVSMCYTNGQMDVWLDENRKGSDHVLSTSSTSNYITVVISSPSSKPLKLNSGNLFYFNINTSFANAGNYIINLKNVIAATPEANRLTLPDCKITLQERYYRGDANGDGEVDVADYVVVCNKILHRNPSPFYSDAADYNGDGSIDVADLVNITNVAIGKMEKTIGGGN